MLSLRLEQAQLQIAFNDTRKILSARHEQKIIYIYDYKSTERPFFGCLDLKTVSSSGGTTAWA